jgi:hypothetical protein
MFEQLIGSRLSEFIQSVVYINIPEDALMVCLLFSIGGAYVLAKFTGPIGNLTVPLNFSALFVGAFLTNWLLYGTDIPMIVHQQEVLVYTVLGMITSSFGLLWLTGPVDV